MKLSIVTCISGLLAIVLTVSGIVLNPDSTRGGTCSNQNSASLALKPCHQETDIVFFEDFDGSNGPWIAPAGVERRVLNVYDTGQLIPGSNGWTKLNDIAGMRIAAGNYTIRKGHMLWGVARTNGASNTYSIPTSGVGAARAFSTPADHGTIVFSAMIRVSGDAYTLPFGVAPTNGATRMYLGDSTVTDDGKADNAYTLYFDTRRRGEMGLLEGGENTQGQTKFAKGSNDGWANAGWFQARIIVTNAGDSDQIAIAQWRDIDDDTAEVKGPWHDLDSFEKIKGRIFNLDHLGMWANTFAGGASLPLFDNILVRSCRNGMPPESDNVWIAKRHTDLPDSPPAEIPEPPAGVRPAGKDWPTYRANAARNNYTTAALPRDLHLHWTLKLPKPTPAWPDNFDNQGKVKFDSSYQPVVAGGTMYVGSMVNDTVTAYETRTGKLKWRFFADGPVRFAPVVWENKVFFVSDDGYLYCLAARDGKLKWRVRGGPADRLILGNHRMISSWPARGGPVVADESAASSGKAVYFAASIWPFMGTFIHAVDAQTGKTIWCNSGTGADYVFQPHTSPSFGGVAPQGYIAVTGDRLLVPSGRSVPACLDRTTGRQAYYRMHNRRGGCIVSASRRWFLNDGVFYRLDDGEVYFSADKAVKRAETFAIRPSRMWAVDGEELALFARQPIADAVGQDLDAAPFDYVRQRTIPVPGGIRKAFFAAGEQILAVNQSGDLIGVVTPEDHQQAKVFWQIPFPYEVSSMIAGDHRLFVVTNGGRIYCFGEGDRGLSVTSAADRVTLIEQGSVWKYLDGGSVPAHSSSADHPGVAWQQLVSYNDRQWKQGPEQLGYGEGDEATVTSFGANPEAKHITTYFRHTFEIDNPESIERISMRALIDDGMVIYLNGREICRLNMPGGPITLYTRASTSARENEWQHLGVRSADHLIKGTNLLAVEVHQVDGSSSDVSFDMELTGILAVKPERNVLSVENHARADQAVESLLKLTEDNGGYAIVAGEGSEFLAEQLTLQSDLHVIVLEPDANRARIARDRFCVLGIYGTRITVIPGTFETLNLPPYFANIISLEQPLEAEMDATALAGAFACLRPYGGVLRWRVGGLGVSDARALLKKNGFDETQVTESDGYLIVRRSGALPGSADWTHQYADVGNTVVSADKLVRLPLGVLWFGGPSNEGILPRHGNGPIPQVAGGRRIIEGRNMLRAVDVYTGRLLWQRELPDLGQFYDNTSFSFGTNAIGSNYVSMPDGIYVAHGRSCLVLDPKTGQTLRQFELRRERQEQPMFWGYIGVYDEVLIAGGSPVGNDVERKDGRLYSNTRFAAGSASLSGLNRRNGKLLWRREARYNFRHNAIAAGNGKVFCLDRMSDQRLGILRRRGIEVSDKPILCALDAQTGKVLWSNQEQTFATWLGYSKDHDVLILSGSPDRGYRLPDEATGLTVGLRGSDGKVLWSHNKGSTGPPMLHKSAVLTPHWAIDLITGKVRMRSHPLTGRQMPWNFWRNYGCNFAIGGMNLITFRSAAAGFFDIASNAGSGHFGGFRAGCTSNLVPANGVLNAPDYTRTCVCPYPTQTSLALIHMPELETWTFNRYEYDGQPVSRVGINFGAPGDRLDPEGLLWLDYPSVGGESPDIPVKIQGPKARFYRHHSMTFHYGQAERWIAASGVIGAKTIRVDLAKESTAVRRYTVRLYFAEPNADTVPGERVFDLFLQEQKKLAAFDVAKAARRTRTPFVVELPGIEVDQQLELTMAAVRGEPILSGIEIAAESAVTRHE